MDQADVASAREVEATLRGRLDTESMAIAREAASHEDLQREGEQAPSALDDEPQTSDLTGAVAADEAAYDEDAGGVEQETVYLEQETAYLDRETAYLEGEGSEPETVEPEIEPSTAPASDDDETTVYNEPVGEEAASEPPRDAEPESEESGFDEEPALAEESRSQDFFDRSEETSAEEGRANSRIFRASRFLRRRDE